ncbi:uncharacterized protein ACLA_091710 [Aspergillus clavatus NRRL 1]|uniref:Uncharacterized protein n=1 Tax=Aspergillus clavatus (strain ATCC 1007 / CBS 513.65 / DSM 816 / NCTC 3887 / NRRL 1 / QM 1276 / 107) TaxID=344612 RepID=A1CF24_ASPCL|nr:uncharacterized protein ACLA_091710 [Aspergillus clavatus NRRL 1]EAW11473.1 hypothetical protein ACLA_091710 [Aspergillus clavatus NRRL 1]
MQKKVIERKKSRAQKKQAFEIAEQDFQRKFGDYLQQKKLKQELRGPTRRALDAVERWERKYLRATQRHSRAQRVARNEWQRQRNRLVRENLERYKNEQPVIDSERQLAGKVVDEEVMGALERTGYMTPQHMTLIDTLLTMPGPTVEKEYQRRIAAINAIITFCDVEEGSPTKRPKMTQKRRERPHFPLQLRLFALKLNISGRRFVSFALGILVYQIISESKAFTPLDPSVVTLLTFTSCHIRKICRSNAASAGKT